MNTAQAKSLLLLAQASFFSPLNEADREAVLSRMRQVAFSAGQVIFSRDDEAREIYLVTDGRVRLSILSSDGRELSLAHATNGDVFGEIAVLDGGRRTADATALSNVEALSLSRNTLLQLMGERPSIALAAIRFLCDRLRTTDTKIEAIALYPIEVRLARFLLSVVRLQSPLETRKEYRMSLGMSQGELALLLGASRPKVNRAIAALEEAQAIRRDGAQFVCDLSALASYVDDAAPGRANDLR